MEQVDCHYSSEFTFDAFTDYVLYPLICLRTIKFMAHYYIDFLSVQGLLLCDLFRTSGVLHV